MLPGPNTSEVTTLWRYTNPFIIIIIKLKQKMQWFVLQKINKWQGKHTDGTKVCATDITEDRCSKFF